MEKQKIELVKIQEVKTSPVEEEKIKEIVQKELKQETKKNKNPFYPTKIIEYLFSFILLISVIISLFSFPIGSLTNLNSEEDIIFEIGYPFPFFKVDTNDFSKNPIHFGNLILDILIYLFLAYLINVTINLTIKNVKEINNEDEKEIKEENYENSKREYVQLKNSGKNQTEIEKIMLERQHNINEIKKIRFELDNENLEKERKKKDTFEKAKTTYKKLLEIGKTGEEVDKLFIDKKWKPEDLEKIKQEIRNETKI